MLLTSQTLPFFKEAMSPKLILGAIFLFISTWASMGESLQDRDDALLPADTLPCLERLLPCQQCLNDKEPPRTCCKVVKTILAASPHCFCTLFNNPELVQNLHTTREEALKLPDKCTYKNNLTSWCNNQTHIAGADAEAESSSTVIEAPAPNGLTSTAASSMRLMSDLTSLDVILGVGGVLLFTLEV